MKVDISKFKETIVVANPHKRKYKKVFISYYEAKKFSDSGKKVWVDTSNPIRPLYFVYVHIDTLFDIC